VDEGDCEATDAGWKEGRVDGPPLGTPEGAIDDKLEGYMLGITDGIVVGKGLGGGEGATCGEDSFPSRTSTLSTDAKVSFSRSRERNLTRPPLPRLNPLSTMSTIVSMDKTIVEVT
jgi:hypothetical protein